MIEPGDLARAAPRPWSAIDIGSHRGIQVWVVDANARKIVQIFGKADEKAFTAALIVSAVNATEAAPPTSASIEDIGDKLRALHAGMENAGFTREPPRFRR